MESKQVGVGVGVLLKKDGKILLGKRHDDPEKADSELGGEGTWTLPGGGMRYKESPEEAACREVKEETDLEVKKKDLKKVSVTNDISGDTHFVTIGFLCEESDGRPGAMEPDQIIKWEWFDLNDLPSPIFPPSKKIIQKVKSGKTLIL